MAEEKSGEGLQQGYVAVNLQDSFESFLDLEIKPHVAHEVFLEIRNMTLFIHQRVETVLELDDMKKNMRTLQTFVLESKKTDLDNVDLCAKFDMLRVLVEQIFYKTLKNFLEFILARNTGDFVKNLFFAGYETDDAVIKQVKRLRTHFHPDVVPENEIKTLAHEVFTLIETISEKMKKNFNDLYNTSEEKLEFYLCSARFHLKVAEDYEKEINIRGKDGAFRSPGRFENLSKEQLLTERKTSALLACSFYHSAIRTLDLLDKKSESFKYMTQRVTEREQMARCHFLAGNSVEVQLYLIAAMHIALDMEDSEVRSTIVRLQNFMMQVKSGRMDSPASKSDVVPTKSVEHALTTYNPKAQKKLRAALMEDTQQWIVKQVIRADGTIACCHAPEEEILRTQNLASTYTAGGMLLGSGGIVVAMAPVAIVAAEAFGLVTVGAAAAMLACPGLLAIGGIAFLASIYCGVRIFYKGQSLAEEHPKRTALNKNITAAFDYFSKMDKVKTFEALGTPYGDERLFVFEQNKYLVIDPANIVTQLLVHGFRADGVAYILNMIADCLISGELVFPDKSPVDLNSIAKSVFFQICDNKELEEMAVNLDKKVVASRSEVQIHAINWLRRHYYAWFEGVPDSYFNDAQEAPFMARLSEMRNIARMNIAILFVIEQNERSKNIARDNIKIVRDSINSNFQYFSVNARRLEAIEDFLFAVGYSIEDDEREKANYERLLLTSLPKRKLIWGNTSVVCEDVRIVTSETSLEKLFAGARDDIENNELRYLLMAIIDKEDFANTEPLLVGEAMRVPVDLTLHRRLHTKMVAMNPVTADCIEPELCPIISQIFGIPLVLCTAAADKHNFVLLNPFDSTSNQYAANPVFLCMDANNKVKEVFRAQLPASITLRALYLFSVATKKVAEARIQKGVSSVAAWWDAFKCFTAVLNEISFTWRFLWVRSKMSTVHAFEWEHNMAHKYLPIRSLFAEEIDAVTSLMECLVEMSKYNLVIQIVTTLKSFTSFEKSHKFWYWYAIATRKSRFYFDASVAIQRALQLQPDCELSVTERRIIAALRANKVTSPVCTSLLNNSQLLYNVNYDVVEPRNTFYDILSIDGGGTRGVIPAYIISEIERRARKPMYQLVDMQTGTSTGAIISAALSIPAQGNNNKPLLARDLVYLYTNPKKLQSIFSRSYNIFGILGSKYTGNRESVIKDVLGDTLMSASLNDLVVVSVKEGFDHKTTCFTSYCKGQDDVRAVDALMASSAAPTFFPAHKIGDATYVDGGVQANNPAQLASSIAQDRVTKDKIRIWSLGTGDLVPDPLEGVLTPNRGGLYWATRAHEVAMNGQQGSVDENLSRLHGENYHRWQIWLDGCYTLDDYRDKTLGILVEHARQYIEDNTDEIRKCVNLLLKNKGFECL